MATVLADVIVGAALMLTLAFAATAFLGMEQAAAWLAGGLVVAGVVRLGVIVVESASADY